MSDLLDAARAWAAQDPDEATRSELADLIERAEGGDAEAGTDLAARFAGRLQFGTAGLRGELGAGPMRMNRVLVAQAAAGLAAFLGAREPHPSIVIGFDGRRNSDVFARDTAELMAGAGVRALLMPRMLPTPVLAFAVRHLDASAGVMVTASHNPAPDNGYKVYLGGADRGSQIVAPDDRAIEAEILRVALGSIAELPRDAAAIETVDDDVIEAYVQRTAEVAGDAPPPPWAYTALHGVGWETMRRVVDAAGYPPPTVVDEQLRPDPAFPTTPFPNPEEPGVLDLAVEAARRSGARLVIANDPDADRLAVAVPDPGAPEGWRALTGNEVGLLLGRRAVRRLATEGRTGTLACSLVSSPGLAALARSAGLGHAETLTGFKWISRAPDLAFGYEEALGYLVDPDKVLDKDGVSAALAMLDLAGRLDAAGTDLLAELDDIAAEIGGYASGQVSLRVADLAQIPRIMERMRTAPPTEIGGIAVRGVDDFLTGVGDLPPSDILRLRLADDARVIVRPSGTEPKLKVYLDASSLNGSGAERRATAAAIVDRLDTGVRELLA